MPRAKRYLLTPSASRHLREARAWSMARWGDKLTRIYFSDLHDAANDLARNYARYRSRGELSGGTGLRLYLVREHFIVFEPLGEDKIIIVAVLRQSRDIPAVLRKYKHVIMRELSVLRENDSSS